MKAIDINMISGLRKSGTTLTKSLLDGHPELFVIPPAEFDFFCYSHHRSLVQPKYDSIKDPNLLLKRLANQDFIARMNHATRKERTLLPANTRQRDTRSSFDVAHFLHEAERMNVGSYADIFIELFTAMAKSCGLLEDQIHLIKFVFKNTLETEFFGLYKKWFPKMKLLYVIRNPYAQFAAQTRGEFIEGRKFSYPLLAPYINIMKHDYYFIDYWKEIYPNDIKVVRYEDLVESTENIMKEVAVFFGVKFNKTILKPTILGEPWGGNSSAKGEVYSGIDSKPLHRWKGVLNTQEIYIVNKYFSDVIQRYGYALHEGKRGFLPLHRSETFRRYVGNKYLEYAPYY